MRLLRHGIVLSSSSWCSVDQPRHVLLTGLNEVSLACHMERAGPCALPWALSPASLGLNDR
jgi:hypothetical protein